MASQAKVVPIVTRAAGNAQAHIREAAGQYYAGRTRLSRPAYVFGGPLAANVVRRR